MNHYKNFITRKIKKLRDLVVLDLSTISDKKAYYNKNIRNLL